MMKSRTAILLIIILVSMLSFSIPYGRSEIFSLKGYPLTLILDVDNGACIRSASFNPIGVDINSSIYMGRGILLNDLMIDIIPPAVFPDENVPSDWWPGYSVNQHVDPGIVNDTVYTETITVSYPVSIHRVSLSKYIIFHRNKPYVDLIYRFTNHEDKPVIFDLSKQWLRPVSFGLTLSSRFGGDPDDDYQVYGLTNGSIVYHQYFSSWGVNNGKPDTANASIKFIALFSGPDDYRDYGETIILIPIGDTIKHTYAVWFEINGLGVNGVKPSLTIRLEMGKFTIKPHDSIVFKYRLYIGPAVESLLEYVGLGEYTGKLIEAGLVKNAVVEGYDKPPYTVVLQLNPPESLNTSLKIYYISDNNQEILVGFKRLVEPKNQFLLKEPGKYIIELGAQKGLTIDRKYEYVIENIGYRGGNSAQFGIYESKTIPINLKLKPISWITIKLSDELGNTLKLRNYTVKVRFISEGYEKTYELNKPILKIYIPVNEYTVLIKPVNLGNRTLGDIYIDNNYVITNKKGNTASFKLSELRPGSSHVLIIKYIPAGSLVSGPPVNVIAFALLAVIGIMIILLIAYYRRRKY